MVTSGDKAMLFHYTVGNYLPQIKADGIQPATARIDPGERPVVWLTASPIWDKTANKMLQRRGELVRLDVHQTAERGGGLVRISIGEGVVVVSWREWRKTSGVKSGTAKRLERTAIESGSLVENWWVSYSPILSSMFDSIQTSMEGMKWTAHAGGNEPPLMKS